MTRRIRGQSIESDSVSGRAIKADSVDTDHLRTNAITRSKIRPGAVDGSLIEAQSIRIKHLHPEMLPYPPVSDGTTVEAFSFQSSVSLTTGNGADPCNWTALASGTIDEFHTANISGVASSGTFTTITVPAGMWSFRLDGDLDAASGVSSGRVLAGFNFTSISGSYGGWEVSVPYHAFTTDTFKLATLHTEKVIYEPTSFSASVYVSNFLNVSLTADTLYWTGRQISAGTVTTG